MDDVIHFISVNVDGEDREWDMTLIELRREYYGKCDLPSHDDLILSCDYAGAPLYFKNFGDMVYTFLGIDHTDDVYDSVSFEAEDVNDEVWDTIIEKLREIPGFKVWYGDGNWMTFSVPKRR